ncbi:calmodulin-beta-like [Ruditapes philippinarum]|uniref:calmodulin-beta-like n=1 Tax=Ruditapes philippinarum TaxID=129788 RepID=UPI00295A9D17|nr:calmodulin-beta-like [Ruditapes philippinarum]
MTSLLGLASEQKFEWNVEVEKKFNEVFDNIDTDKNGKLTFDEVKDRVLTGVLRQMGQNPTDSEIKQYLDGIDRDGDGTVSKEEFREWIKELMTILKDPQKSLDLALQVMFKACDLDGNGKLSRKEFSKFLKERGFPLQNDEVRELFMAVDNDGDVTSLNKEELLSVMSAGRIGHN